MTGHTACVQVTFPNSSALESDYRDITDRFTDRVQTPSPLVVCELIRVLDGRFCFDWGQATHCSQTTIEVERGKTIEGSGNFSYGGASVGVKVTHTARTNVTYQTGACDICQPVMCYTAQLQVFECERFIGVWSWKTIDTVWIPRGAPMLSLNCRKNAPECGCTETAKAQAAPRVYLTGPPASSKILRTARFSYFSPEETEHDEPSTMVKYFSKHLEEWVRPSTAVHPHQAGVEKRDGSVLWVYGEAKADTGLDLLSKDCTHPLRLNTKVTKMSYRKLPVLAVGPCMPGVKVVVRLDLAEPKGILKTFYEGNAQVVTGRVTTVYDEIDLGEVPAGTKGILSIDLVRDNACTETAIVEPIVVQ